MRRIILVLCGVSILLGTAFAEGARESQKAAASNAVEVVNWSWASEAWQPVWDAVLKANPTITMRVVPTKSGDDYFQKLTTAYAAGTEKPDIIYAEMGVRGKIMSMNIMEDLTKAPYNLKKSDMLDFLVPLATDFNGKLVGVEVGPAPGGLAYKRDLAKKYLGTDDPKELERMFSDWDSFIRKGIEVKAKSGGTVYMMTGVGDALSVIRAQAPQPLVDGKKIVLSSVLLKAYKTVERMRVEGILDVMDQWSPAWNASYAGANHIFYPCPSWMPVYVIKPNDKESTGRWGIMLPPEGAFNMGGTLYGVCSESKVKNETWTVIRGAVFCEEGAKLQRDILQYPTAYKPVHSIKGFYEAPDPYFGGQSPLAVFAALADKVKVRPLSRYDADIDTALGLANKALATGMSATDALKEAVAELKRRVPDLTE